MRAALCVTAGVCRFVLRFEGRDSLEERGTDDRQFTGRRQEEGANYPREGGVIGLFI